VYLYWQPITRKKGDKRTHMQITSEHLRMLRGAFRLSVRDLADIARISKNTVVRIEAGVPPRAPTVAKIMEAFGAYVRFIAPTDDGEGPGLILKRGYEALVRGDTPSATASQGEGADRLDALPWDWESEPSGDLEPLPPLDWSDDDKRAQIEHWRARPEAWAKLAEVSRQCLLRAMGVERL
jgi:transcriptional regulator with XRE-family HTH domain